MRAASQNRAAGTEQPEPRISPTLSPRRSDVSVRNIRGVQIESDDDAARIDPSRVAIGGSRGVEARVPAVAQQKRVGDV